MLLLVPRNVGPGANSTRESCMAAADIAPMLEHYFPTILDVSPVTLHTECFNGTVSQPASSLPSIRNLTPAHR
eukprot:scaffold7176_cov134-Cylindrotheca_fusiformis.AAC.8